MTERALRYEIKMVAQAAVRDWIESRLRLDRAGVRTLHPDRTVQSLYFDDLWQTALADNLAGISHREKLRFRWYGEAANGVRGALERKVRHNLLGWKDVLPLEAEVDVEGADRRTLARAIFGHLPAAWAVERDRSLMPVQWIRYRRSYFTTADGRIRVTIDRDLRTFDLRHRRIVTAAFRSFVPCVTIVEAKAAEDAYDELKRFLSRFPLVIDKCSKFVIASSPGDGPRASVLA
jgi:hypothetical protein